MSREAVTTATKTITHWLAHYAPASVVAVDEDGQEHPITVTRQKRKFHIVAKTIEELDAVSVRCVAADGSILATRKLRTVETVEAETVATPATAGGYDVTAVVQCVAKEVREAVEGAFKAAQEMHKSTTSELTAMVRELGQRHAASEKALLEAREAIIAEREERIAEREERAAEAAAAQEREEQQANTALVHKVIEMAGPELMKRVMNGSSAPKIAATVSPPNTAPTGNGAPHA